MPALPFLHRSGLPIDSVLESLRAALAANDRVLLQAPPGAGKTTIVPLAVTGTPWLGRRRIVMLEPRRLAARSAAHRMAARLGEPVGRTVGFRVRMESMVGPATRVEVVTEGVLTRLLQDDPTLDGYGLVIFDEFHERSLHADAGLALTLHTQRLVRPDLRILVMSATLDVAGLTTFLGGPPVVTATGRQFPVETRYVPPVRSPATAADTASATRRALSESTGDILVFLPGVAEIRRCARMLEAEGLPGSVLVVPLHGMLAPDAQLRAIEPNASGRRRVVLATSIAETSITIAGVRVVVDSGLARRPRFSARTGMTRLHTTRVSRAAADQRRGRAGREAPGLCYRLWNPLEDMALLPAAPAEILEADLVPLMLDLAMMGIAEPGQLAWLDGPPGVSVRYARELLRELEAIDTDSRITTHGRRIATFGTHPRLAHMILRATERGLGAIACDIASLLDERDPMRAHAHVAGVDLRVRLDLLHDGESGANRMSDSRPDRDAVNRMRQQARRWRSLAGAAPHTWERDAAGRVLALAYPDRIAQRRPGPAPRFVLRNGTGAQLDPGDALYDAPWLVIAATDGVAPESRIFLAAPLGADDVEAEFGSQLESADEEVVVEESGVIRGMRTIRLGAIVLSTTPLRQPGPDAVRAAIARYVEQRGIHVLSWDAPASHLRQRMGFAHAHDPSWPDVSDGVLASTFRDRLQTGVSIGNVRRLQDLDVAALLRSMLSPARRTLLDRVAPARYRTPAGRDAFIDYTDSSQPFVEVRLQEMFGCRDSPTVGSNRLPLTLRLLTPAGRPVQVTRDLAGFWRTAYHDVRKALRARYPKHDWPEDPLHAAPASRPRRRS